jgi:hypothetical protein
MTIDAFIPGFFVLLPTLFDPERDCEYSVFIKEEEENPICC